MKRAWKYAQSSGNLGEGVIDLIVIGHRLLIPVFQGNAAIFPEGHLPVAVESAAGVDAHRQ